MPWATGGWRSVPPASRRSWPLGLENRQLDPAFDHPGRDRITRESCGVVDAELVHQALPVFFDGLDADMERPRHLLVRFSLRHQLQNLHLAGGQAIAGGIRVPSIPGQRCAGFLA